MPSCPHRHTLVTYTTLFRSDVTRKKTRGFLNGPMATRGESKDINAFSIMIAQRLAIGDASDVFREQGCEHLCLPMRYDPNHPVRDRKSTRLNSSHVKISYAVMPT